MVVDLSYWLHPALVEPYTYGLFFLLGSFTVASLSDIRRMSAQSEFPQVWVLVVLTLLALDAYRLGQEPVDRFVFKWAVTGALCLVSYKRVGLLFRLEWGDVTAMAAVCGLLSPLLVVVFFAILKLMDILLRPFLRHFGHEGAYPFMPVITIATLVTLPTAWYLQSLQLVF